MNCSPFDLKDYFFGELPATERSAVEAHLTACVACRDEISALSGTRSALLTLADEEPPRRIAFVSDKVFAPRWWQRIRTSGPQLGFAAAAMLAVAIMVHGFVTRPVTAAGVPRIGASFTASEADIDRRVRTEVAKAVSASEAKQTRELLGVLNTRLRQSDQRHRENLILVQEVLERMDKRNSVFLSRASYE